MTLRYGRKAITADRSPVAAANVARALVSERKIRVSKHPTRTGGGRPGPFRLLECAHAAAPPARDSTPRRNRVRLRSCSYCLRLGEQGTVDLAWVQGHNLFLTELASRSWDWSEPKMLASFDPRYRSADDVALAYDDSGRLLVAWTTTLDSGAGIGVDSRVREPSGKWRRARTITRLPEDSVQHHIRWTHLALSSGKESFALGWYAEQAGGLVVGKFPAFASSSDEDGCPPRE